MVSGADSGGLDSLQQKLGVRFKDRALLKQALVHSSYLNENPGVFSLSNERLEFLGDAVIGLGVAHELFRIHPAWPEGRLTEARAALVQGESLAVLAEHLGLGASLLMGRGEEASGGRLRPSNLAAAFESLVGALFLDQGYGVAESVTLTLMSDGLDAVGRGDAGKSPKSALQEAVQRKGSSSPSYRITEIAGQDHARRFTAEVSVGDRVLGSGAGARKSEAEQQAAAAALEALDREG